MKVLHDFGLNHVDHSLLILVNRDNLLSYEELLATDDFFLVPRCVRHSTHVSALSSTAIRK